MSESRLHEVSRLGQSIWYDNIQRRLITSGDLQRLIDEDAIVGVTSNPTIFEKAIDGSDNYDDQLRELVRQGVTDPRQIFDALSIHDIQAAADIFRPIYDRTNGGDGYISIEVAPNFANDTRATISEARRLFKLVDRPNVMVKIPATDEGLPAIEEMIYEGVNINITLIFALSVYERVTEAYIRGLEHRLREGLPVTGIASVASFFVSRVDTLVDNLLDEKITEESDPARQDDLRSLQGKAAIANARLAYQRYLDIFHGDRFARLREQGAATQRCLWASTSTKNPNYRDVLYVEELIGPETVDTMPPQTITAFQEHGVARVTVDQDIPGQREIMERLKAAGIDMNAVTKQLEVEGVKSFTDSYNKLLDATKVKAERLKGESEATTEPLADGAPTTDETDTTKSAAVAPVAATAAMADTPPGYAGTSASAPATVTADFTSRQEASLGSQQTAVDAGLTRADAEHFARRVWEKDPSLWKPDPLQQNEITNRLGWLDVTTQMRGEIPRLTALRDDLRAEGVSDLVLLGMGGSSLAPEVLRETFATGETRPRLHVLDSTDPTTILDVTQAIDLPHTVFIVASKSGGTIETLSQFRYFHEKVASFAGDDAGKHFIAITDAGTKLDEMAQSLHFREIFRNPSEIGGRYSALSFFGLVPGAIIGVDIAKLLDRAETMAKACGPDVPARQNPGVWLGAILGTLANGGRDKATLVISPPVGAFGSWLEQLLAESTGKEGKGILPVEGEPLGDPSVYGNDRVFVYLRTESGYDEAQDKGIKALEDAGQPIVLLRLDDTYDLGTEFFRWEFATAIAGAFLGINAFDQPNVQESKDNTDRILKEYTQSKMIPAPRAVLQTQSRNVSLVASGDMAQRLRESVSLQAAMETVARQAGPGDYIALLAYIERTPETQTALQEIRLRLRDLRHVATTLGYGPRFQHSTGQEHKGGPNTGVFLQFVATDTTDVPIPDEPYTFSVLKQAQALGDLQSLEAHQRRVVRIDLGTGIVSGLGELLQALEAAVVE
ncbi:MAG TPA: bifunctional transaldolase/phosoglucose isomerase [Ktedonobacterales bacterium]|nr:bifunctional transaldolase/phosoglucose isomerase [Ktedonobacterales bacterium]